MTIRVSDAFDGKADIKEDLHNEFKTSMFYDNKTHLPSFNQMKKIAVSMAALMNAEGGYLWLGVDDSARPVGIEADLTVLVTEPTSVALRGTSGDEGYTYDGKDEDIYELKLRAIIKFFLSSNAADCIESVLIRAVGPTNRKICRVTIKPIKSRGIVYVNARDNEEHIYKHLVFKRFGNQKRILKDLERDAFIQERARAAMLENVQAVISKNSGNISEQVRSAIAEAMSGRMIGCDFEIEGAISLAEENFAAIKSPKGVVFDGKHVCDVKSWKEAYLAILDKLQEIDASKFDTLVGDTFFGKYFIVPEGNSRPRGYYDAKHKYGSGSNIRAKEVSGCANFNDDKKIVRRLLTHFEIDLGRFALRG